MDEIAMAFPDLKIVMAHMGHPWHADCLMVVRKHANVYADISGQLYRPWSMYNGFRLAHEWAVTEKLFFASDWPVTTPQESIDSLKGFNRYANEHHLPEVPEEELKAILQRDALKLLGLE
jgi:predicted TIM-barrel fold metal-dependent hydrolase